MIAAGQQNIISNTNITQFPVNVLTIDSTRLEKPHTEYITLAIAKKYMSL